MQASVKVNDRLSDDPESNSYINKMSLHRVRVWIRYRARAIAGVKGNFRQGTRVERRGLDLSDWRGLLDFWRRMKIKLAAVT